MNKLNIPAPDLTQRPPRSPRCRLGGYLRSVRVRLHYSQRDRFLSLAAMLLGWFVPLLGLSTRNAEPLHLVDQRRPLQTEPGGCAFLASDDPVGFGQCLEDVFALGIL